MIGERLKSERERLKMTQPAFAEAAGAAKRTLIEWEKGATSPSAVQLSALRDVGVDVLYVLTGEREYRHPEPQDQFIERMQSINIAGKIVDALPLSSQDREGIKLCLTGDAEQDGRLMAEHLGGSDPSPVEGETYGRATVTMLPLHEPGFLTRDQVMTIVLDAMAVAGKVLPAKAVWALVDTGMKLQREGIPVNKYALEAQLKAVK